MFAIPVVIPILMGGFAVGSAIAAWLTGKGTDGILWLGALIYDLFSSILFSLWQMLAYITDLLEDIFEILAGIKKTAGYDGESGAVDNIGDSDFETDTIVSIIIKNETIQNVFTNLAIIAVVLLMFFTILQIIREQYIKADGGNPYIIVFRMFKGMFTLVVVTTAVLVGLQVSGYVLTALNQATGKDNQVTFAGRVFNAMAYDANRIRLGVLDKSGMGLAKRDQEYYDMIPRKNNWQRQKKYLEISTQTINLKYHYEYISGYDKDEPYIQYMDYVFQWYDRATLNNGMTGHTYFVVNKIPASCSGVGIYYDKSVPTRILIAGADIRTRITSIDYTSYAVPTETIKEFKDAESYLLALKKNINEFSKQIEDYNNSYDGDKYGRYKRSALSSDTGYIRDIVTESSTVVNADGVSDQDLVVGFTIRVPYVPDTLSIDKISEDEIEYLDSVRVTVFEDENNIKYVAEPESIFYDAGNLDTLFKRKPFTDFSKSDNESGGGFLSTKNYYLYLYSPYVSNGKEFDIIKRVIIGEAAISYFNGMAVTYIYYAPSFNWIIGFMGLFVCAGVFLNLVFGLIQRVIVLVTYYVVSPLTGAMYPFDDGNSFKNNFFQQTSIKKIIEQ
jgi:hypothetical protein